MASGVVIASGSRVVASADVRRLPCFLCASCLTNTVDGSALGPARPGELHISYNYTSRSAWLSQKKRRPCDPAAPPSLRDAVMMVN